MSEKLKNPRLVLGVAAFAAFLATFNETYLNVGFDPIMRSLGVDVSTVQWLATAYMLGAAVMVPVTAFLYRSFNTKKLFLTTVGLLVVGSVVGALAANFPTLLVGRIIQSIGTGMLIPTGMNITLETAPREKLGTYMGIMGAMTTLGPSLSVIVAGVLLSFFEWNMLLWVFGGLCLLLFLMAAFGLGNIAHLTHPKLDPASVALIGIGLVGILYGLSTAFVGNRIIAASSALASLILLAIFIFRQKKLKEPLINLTPLSITPFSIGVVLNMLALIVIFAMNIIMPIYLQSARDASSMNASMTLFPAIMLSCIVAPIMGRVYDKKGIKIVLPVGFLMICLCAATLAIWRDQMNFITMAVTYIPIICGSAFIIGPVQCFALSRLTSEQNPHGVTLMSTGFQIAGCLGASLFTGVYSAMLGAQMHAGKPMIDASSVSFMVAAWIASGLALIGMFIAIYLAKFDKRAEVQVQPESIEQGMPTLQSIMKTDVYTVRDTDTLISAIQFMVDKKISGMPVLDETDSVVGFLSDTDIMRSLSRITPVFGHGYAMPIIPENRAFAHKLDDLKKLTVADVARQDFVTVDINDDLGNVCTKLLESHAKKAPVMSNGKMIGIINRSNITKFAMRRSIKAVAS